MCYALAPAISIFFRFRFAGLPMNAAQSQAFPRNRARGLWIASCLFLGLMPLGMAIAHRSAALFVVLSALLALGALSVEGTLSEFFRDVKRMFVSPPGLAILLFLLWALLSLSWTYSLRVSLFTFGELILSAAAGVIVAVALPRRMPRWVAGFAACCVIAAALLIFADIQSGLRIRQMLGVRAYAFIFNRSVLTMFLIMVPLTFLLWRRNELKFRIAGIAGAALTVAIIFLSDSGAAALAVVGFIPVYIVARLLPRAAIWIGGACFAAILIAAPVYGTIFDEMLPARIADIFRGDHASERISLWLSFQHAIQAEPVLGGGFGVSPVIASTSVVDKVPLQYREMLAIGHPHNAAMQVWVELGAVGAVLAFIALVAMLRSVARLPSEQAAEQLAWIAAVALVALVGHGAWQGWWIAAIGAGMAWFRAERIKADSE